MDRRRFLKYQGDSKVFLTCFGVAGCSFFRGSLCVSILSWSMNGIDSVVKVRRESRGQAICSGGTLVR